MSMIILQGLGRSGAGRVLAGREGGRGGRELELEREVSKDSEAEGD